MDRIVRLPESVANQIAAGEVVERPASVIKELVENALDAGARRIEVDVEQGGQERIRVADDGWGMSASDAVACLERHATSKIRSAADLHVISTLGFRGEALPSIASVSRFRLTTRRPEDEAGVRVRVDGGSAPEVTPCGAPAGTLVEVEDLFFNVPARRKFMRRASTEMGHVSETLVRLALSVPRVQLRLRTQDRVVLDVPALDPGDARGRLSRILGRSVAERLHPLVPDAREHRIQVDGFIGEPGLHERTTRAVYTFVNGRFVRDRTLLHGIQEAYRGLVEPGRHPVVVLFIGMEPGEVDVNVHPQKSEVRFRAPRDLHRAIVGAVGRSLESVRQRPVDLHPGRWAETVAAARRPADGTLPGPDAAGPRFPRPVSAGSEPVPMFLPRSPGPAGTEPGRPAATEPDWLRPVPVPLGVAFGRYLLAEVGPRLRLVDVRSIKIRQAYERLRRGAEPGSAQGFLVPKVVEVGPALVARVEDRQAELAAMGMELEVFGEDSVVLSCKPSGLRDEELDELVRDLLEDEAPDAASRTDRWARRAARALDVVIPRDRESWSRLLASLDEDPRWSRSLEGKPTTVDLEPGALARLFEDVG